MVFVVKMWCRVYVVVFIVKMWCRVICCGFRCEDVVQGYMLWFSL